MKSPHRIYSSFVLAAPLASILLLGCGMETLDADEALSGSEGKATRVGSAQQAALSTAEVQMLDQVMMAYEKKRATPFASYRYLGAGPDGSALYTTPAVPGSDAPVTLIVKAATAPATGKSLGGEVHFSGDGWKTTRKATAKVITQGRTTYLVFDLGKETVGRTVALAVRLDRCGDGSCTDSFWMNNQGANYSFGILAPGAMQFIGNRAAWMSAIPVGLSGGTIYQGHELTVTVQTYPIQSGQQVTLHYTTDGHKTVQSLPMSFDFDAAGEYGNNLQWYRRIPTTGLADGTDIAYWMSARDSTGQTRWDSNGGANFRARVATAPKVGWMGAGRFTFIKHLSTPGTCLSTSQYYNWCYSPGLEDPFTADYSKYQAYGSYPHLALELYVPGITDQPWSDGSAQAIGALFFKVEFTSDALGGKAGGSFLSQAMTFGARRGNNFVFHYRPYCPAGKPQLCGAGEIPDGTYHYKFRASVDNGKTWSSLGTDAFPAAGTNRTFIWKFGY